MTLHHIVVSSCRFYGNLLLSVEAERQVSGAAESGSDVGADAGGRRLHTFDTY
jgi:hypothetical protein